MIRRVALIASLALLGGMLVWAETGLPDFGHYAGRYGREVAATFVTERHASNAVVVTAFDYRAVDTLGEEMILFASATAVALLLRSRRDEDEREAAARVAEHEERRSSVAVRWVGGMLVGPIALLAAYIVTHGHLSPGGGFPGGVILLAAAIMPLLAGRWALVSRLRDQRGVEVVEAVGAWGFGLIGLGGLIASGAFLQNFLGKGHLGLLDSGGIVLPANVSVGLEVGGALLVLVAELVDPRFLTRDDR